MNEAKLSIALLSAVLIATCGPRAALAVTTDLNVKTDCSAVGNGVANDTSAIQTCINTAATSGQAVYFPAGVYNINTALSIASDNITLYGTNNGTATIVQTTSSANLLNISKGGPVVNKTVIRGLEFYYGSQNPTGLTIYCNNCWRTFFRDLSFGKTLTGPTPPNTPHWFSTGIWAVDGSEVYVEDSRFTGASSNGMVFQHVGELNLMNIQVNSSEGDTTVTGIVFDGGTGGIYATDVNVTAGETGFLFENTYGGTGTANYPTFGFFTHCLADSQAGTGWDFNTAKSMVLTNSWAATAGGVGILIEAHANTINITDSRIINNGGIGLQVQAGATEIAVKNTMISGNSRVSSGSWAGIDVAAGVSNFQIQDNRIGAAGDFGATQSYGIRIAAGAGDNIMITGNDLRGNATGELSNGATGTHTVIGNNL